MVKWKWQKLLKKKGKVWVTTGIVRNGKTYSSIEETLYLMVLGALHLLDNGETCVSLADIYGKVSSRQGGCAWELLEVYRNLKSLGTEESKQLVNMGSRDENSINELFSEMWINELRPDFDVYLPNNRFTESYPGHPNFPLYLSRGHSPSRAEIEVLEKRCLISL